MYPDATVRCLRCGWSNSHQSLRCRGCSVTLLRSAVRPVPAAARRSSLLATVTGGPSPMKMVVLQPFWLTTAASPAFLEQILNARTAILPTLAGFAAVALLVHLASRRPLASRALRRVSPLRHRTGMRVTITDDAGQRWAVRLLPTFGTDLHNGDPVFATGFQNRYGEFRAVSITNIRTGTRHSTRWITTLVIIGASILVTTLVIILPATL